MESKYYMNNINNKQDQQALRKHTQIGSKNHIALCFTQALTGYSDLIKATTIAVFNHAGILKFTRHARSKSGLNRLPPNHLGKLRQKQQVPSWQELYPQLTMRWGTSTQMNIMTPQEFSSCLVPLLLYNAPRSAASWFQLGATYTRVAHTRQHWLPTLISF